MHQENSDKDNILDNEDRVEKVLNEENSFQSNMVEKKYTELENENGKISINLFQEILEEYQNGVIEYKEGIRKQSREIKRLRDEIESLKEDISKEERLILKAETQQEFENKDYEALNHLFTQLINSIEELRSNYKEVIDEQKYDSIYKSKKRELTLLLDKIEIRELSLLKSELQRLNMVGLLEPKLKQLNALKATLQEIEVEKEHFEISMIPQHLPRSKKKSDFVVDTVVLES